MNLCKLTIILLFALSLCSCSGGHSQQTSIIPPLVPVVQAASGFTNASISGSYAFGGTGAINNNLAVFTGIATVDGNGNITSGEETAQAPGISCRVTFTGTYNINSNGTGKVTLASTPDGPSAAAGCLGGTGSSTFALANGGNIFYLSSSQPGSVSFTTAVKQ